MQSKITIIRHAPTQYNTDNIFMGTLDIPITSFDEKKIKEVKKILSFKNYTSIYSSPLQRAFQTAKEFFDDNNIIIDNRLIERNLGIWQGEKKEAIKKNNLKAFYDNLMNFYYTPQNGENYLEVISRVSSFIYECCTDKSNIIVFTHHCVFKVIKSLLTETPLSISFKVKEPFLFPQTFTINDDIYSKIEANPFFTIDK